MTALEPAYQNVVPPQAGHRAAGRSGSTPSRAAHAGSATAASGLTRREMLSRCGMGLGLLGAHCLAFEDAAAAVRAPMAPRAPHFRPRARHVIHVFLNGGPSHVDTFDPKPALQKYAGRTLPTGNLKTERKTGAAFPSPFRFRKCGQSGIEVSEIFPYFGECIDDVTVIRSMHANVPNHEPSLMLMNCGEQRLPRPSMGSWITYGLGTENQNLPGFVVMCPGGYPVAQTQNWRSAFLPGAYQGTYIDPRQTEIEKLLPYIRNHHTPADEQRRQLDLLRSLNRLHRDRRDFTSELESRIHAYELAYRMQFAATEAFDLSREPKSIHALYGDGVHARQLMIARRLVERGVRFVQVWHGAGQPWDSHDDLEQRHAALARQLDRPLAALIRDLKQRGLLQETLIIVGGEFGRTPTVELPTPGANQGKINGRDHNHYGFTVCLAGGGVKGGFVYGATDEFGFRAVENRVHVHDLHATILHLLGFDHERLTYRFAGRDFRLTDVGGRVIHDIIA
ncbi:MAG: DUF1501 domain-containing protein [Planctomycetota bacterium]|nr:MAG: DUF1501 domain-containing protein [Planctomycetota bacterium]